MADEVEKERRYIQKRSTGKEIGKACSSIKKQFGSTFRLKAIPLEFHFHEKTDGRNKQRQITWPCLPATLPVSQLVFLYFFVGKKKKTGRFLCPVGRFFVCDIFYRVFELPSPRNAQKRDTKSRKKWFWIFRLIFCKNFSTRFFCSLYCGSYMYGCRQCSIMQCNLNIILVYY